MSDQFLDDNGNLIERGHGAPPQNVHLHAKAAARHVATLAEQVDDAAKALVIAIANLAAHAKAAATDVSLSVSQTTARPAPAQEIPKPAPSPHPAQVHADKITRERKADLKRQAGE